ncbi:MAG: Dabb family protein, partial [Bryobacteraceae bacterium]
MRRNRLAIAVLATAGIFFAGYAAGEARVNHFGQPKTVLQVSIIKFRDGTTDAQQAQMIAGLKRMAGQITGIKNIWTHPDHMDPRNFDTAFVIEFVNRDAADHYAESPIHEAWS